MQNPFTTTFSKMPNYSYIPTQKEREIIENFGYDEPSESVYKITGVRGSGKTVILAKVEQNLLSEEQKNRGWIVYRLSPTRDMLNQLAAFMIRDGYYKDESKNINVNLSASVLGNGGGIGFSKTKENKPEDIGVQLDEMIKIAVEKNKKIFVGIDEVSKTPEMIDFATEFGKWLRAGYPVYMVCTGLYENMTQVSNVQNLTFFRRATNIKTEPLNLVRVSEMYKSKLNIDLDVAKTMAKMTKGYAYAFQELGVLAFKNSNKKLESLEDELKSELYAYSYEKIWEELSAEDKELLKLLIDEEENKRADIIDKMGEKAGNYCVYRDRLWQRGLINKRQGYISLSLPYFGEYIKDYCMM